MRRIQRREPSFNEYIDAGGNFIDTANKYTEGTNEKYIGEFISSDRYRFVLATKYTSNTRRRDPNAPTGKYKKNNKKITNQDQRLQKEKKKMMVVD